MKIVARLKTISEIEKLINLGVDVFLVDTPLAVKKIEDQVFSSLEAIKKTSKEIYLLANKMIHQEDLEELRKLLIIAKKHQINGIVVGDITAMIIAKELGIENKIIYQPGTMNTSSFDSEYFKEKSIKGITISKEITIEEIERFFTNKQIELSLIGHGYLDMFYSKRKLLTNYFIYKGIKRTLITDNYCFRLKEEIRDKSNYPIFEDYSGTHIFRDKALESFSEFKVLSKGIDDFFVERIFLTDEEYYEALAAYNNLEKAEAFLNKYGDNYNKGFYYQYTEKLKGDLNEN